MISQKIEGVPMAASEQALSSPMTQAPIVTLRLACCFAYHAP